MDVAQSGSVTAVEKYFFTPLYYPLSPLQVIGWWERRRLAYNVCVGAAGLMSLGTMVLLDPGPRSAMADAGLLIGVLVYGFAANACYTFGWIADLALRRTLGIRAPDLAPVMLRYGFVFSVGLSLLPIPVVMATRLVVAVTSLFGGGAP